MGNGWQRLPEAMMAVVLDEVSWEGLFCKMRYNCSSHKELGWGRNELNMLKTAVPHIFGALKMSAMGNPATVQMQTPPSTWTVCLSKCSHPFTFAPHTGQSLPPARSHSSFSPFWDSRSCLLWTSRALVPGALCSLKLNSPTDFSVLTLDISGCSGQKPDSHLDSSLAFLIHLPAIPSTCTPNPACPFHTVVRCRLSALARTRDWPLFSASAPSTSSLAHRVAL